MASNLPLVQNKEIPFVDLPMWKVILYIFVPTSILTMAYVGVGQIPAVQKAIPSLLLFFLLAVLILFPVEILLICFASKKTLGKYSLKSAFTNHQKLPLWQIALFGSLAWLFAGLMTLTIAPLETLLFAPISERLSGLLPTYFDWTNIEYLENYSRSILILTAVVLFVFNGFIGPIIEELFFRGYLTARISRFGKYAPLIITVLFSLYHFWLPFNNLFRIIAFFPAFYIAWKKRNIFISIVTHCLSNLFSTVSIILLIRTLL
jgi:membrane protease YdiL (CAAX protease family)